MQQTAPVQPPSNDHTEASPPRPNLLLAHFSMRYADYPDRLAAAVAGGFQGIGFFVDEYLRLIAAGWTDESLVAALHDHGLVAPELEALTGWATLGERSPHSIQREEALLHMADVFGATHMQAIGPYEGTFADCIEAYARLCDRAVVHGQDLRVAIEFLPFTNLPNADVAMEVVNGAGRANGGLCVDTWHHERGARDWSMLEAIPAERVINMQFDDGPIVPVNPDYLTDTISYREVPGEGEFDLVRFLQLMKANGVTAPISVEVISLQLQQLPPVEVGRRLGEATRAILDAASW